MPSGVKPISTSCRRSPPPSSRAYPSSRRWRTCPPWLWMFANALPILLMPLVGWAIDRWGPRRVTLFGLTTIVAAFIIDHWTHFPGDSHLIIFIVGAGTIVSGTLPMATTINNWYRRRRATAMALMMTPSIVVFTVLLAFGISHAFAQQLNAYTGIIATAFILLAMSLLIRTLVRNRPEDYGQLPDGATHPAPQNENQVDAISPQSAAPEWEWRQALNSRVFWLLTAGGSASATPPAPRSSWPRSEHTSDAAISERSPECLYCPLPYSELSHPSPSG